MTFLSWILEEPPGLACFLARTLHTVRNSANSVGMGLAYTCANCVQIVCKLCASCVTIVLQFGDNLVTIV